MRHFMQIYTNRFFGLFLEDLQEKIQPTGYPGQLVRSAKQIQPTVIQTPGFWQTSPAKAALQKVLSV